jgi:hypothetical protein
MGLYDVARISNAGINHASSAGLEFLSLGVPVIHYDPPRLNAYPPSLGLTVERFHEQDFTDSLARALDTPRSTDIALKAWRWYAVSLLRALTHKTWEYHRSAEAKQSPKRSMPWVRNMIPANIRERVSRTYALRDRVSRIQGESSGGKSTEWVQECINRIYNFDDSSLWNPLAIIRGEPLSPEMEREEVHKRILLIEQLTR